jgi:Xaa-Pro aminopeptidase
MTMRSPSSTAAPARRAVNRRCRPLHILLATTAIPLAGIGQPAAAQDPWVPPAAPAPVGAIQPAEHAARRAALAQTLEDGVFLAVGEPEPTADYLPFVQNSDFLYLTGVTEPAAALVMVKRGTDVREWLFVLPRNPSREIWEGYRLGAEGALRLTGIPSRPNTELAAVLDSLLAGGGPLYTITAASQPRLGAPLGYPTQVLNLLVARHPGVRVVPVTRQLSSLRGRKSTAELDLLRRAVWITNIAHTEILRTIEPGLHEFEIQALLEYTFRRYGADRPSFASIVGSGPNSTTLHYNENDRLMRAGDVVVIDIGASYRGYAADVTRTLPVGGRFSPEQRSIYEVVLAAQKAAEELARPGATMGQLSSDLAGADRVAGGHV